MPPYVRLYEIDSQGRVTKSDGMATGAAADPAPADKRIHWTRRLKQKLMPLFGQVLDPQIGYPLRPPFSGVSTQAVGPGAVERRCIRQFISAVAWLILPPGLRNVVSANPGSLIIAINSVAIMS